MLPWIETFKKIGAPLREIFSFRESWLWRICFLAYRAWEEQNFESIKNLYKSNRFSIVIEWAQIS
jgi:hypothetical protein